MGGFKYLLLVAGGCACFGAGFWFRRSEVYLRWHEALFHKLNFGVASGDSAFLEKEVAPFESPWEKLPQKSPLSEKDLAEVTAACKTNYQHWRSTRVPAPEAEREKYFQTVQLATDRQGNHPGPNLGGKHLVFDEFSAFAANLVTPPINPGMDTSVVAFHQWLKLRGIALMVVLVPNPLDIQAHDFDPLIPVDADLHPSQTQMVGALLDKGIAVVDLRWAFCDPANREFGPFHDPTNHEWNVQGMRLASAEVATYLRRLPLVQSAQSSAWTFQERWISSRPTPTEKQTLVHVVERGGLPLPRDPACPIVTLGDCHLYMDGMADKGVSGDFTSHLAQKVGLPLNCLYRVGGGSMLSGLVADRLGAGDLKSPQLVIWVISSLADANWPEVAYDTLFEKAAQEKRSHGDTPPSRTDVARPILVKALPDLKSLPSTPYRDVLGLVHAEDSLTHQKLLLMMTIKHDGKIIPLLLHEGSAVEVHGCFWEEKLRKDAKVQSWQQMGDDNDLEEQRYWVDSIR